MASIKDWVLKKEASDDDPLDEIEDSLEEMRPTGDEADVLEQIEQTLEEMENRKEAEIQDHVDIIIDAFNVLRVSSALSLRRVSRVRVVNQVEMGEMVRKDRLDATARMAKTA
jgi:uncharacterized iron-regulated protein